MSIVVKRAPAAWQLVSRYVCADCRRRFSQSAITSSGHSKWATIKHDKAKNDHTLSRQRQAHAKSIADAVRFGGADANANPRLALAIATAKKGSFPKASIETAILRGQGRSASGAPLENITIEAVIPPVGVIIECQTDSKARTLQDLRAMLKNHGGSQSPAVYLFEKRGRVTFHSKDGIGVDEAMEAALDAGALDVNTDEAGRIVLDTGVESLMDAETRLTQQLGLQVESSDTIWFPNPDTQIASLDPGDVEDLKKLQGELEEYPGVQAVYMNLDMSNIISTSASVNADAR